MFSFGLKYFTADADGKLKTLEYEVAGIFVLVALGLLAFFIRRKYKGAFAELQTLRNLGHV